jgi:hypothetical protein
MEGRYYPNLCLERLCTATKIHSQFTDVHVHIRDEHPPNASEHFYASVSFLDIICQIVR